MLERLFTSTTRIKILRLLMFNSDKWYYLRELARKIKTTPTYVKKELDNLTEAGFINKKRKGNLILFHINQDSPIFNELRELFIKSDYILFKQMYEKTAPDISNLTEFNYFFNFPEKLRKTKRGVSDEKE